MALPNSEQVDTSVSKKPNWRIVEPKDFSGVSVVGEDMGNEAFVWLKKMERFKKSIKLSDEEALFVVGDHLTRKAETWFNVIGVKAATWDQFVMLFKKQYLVDQEDKWWFCLQNMKQGEKDSIDDVALKMEELFELLDTKSQVFQVRTFLSAIRPNIGFEVEKDGTPLSFSAAKTKAKQIEKSFLKYDPARIGAVTSSPITDLKSDFIKNHTFKNEIFLDTASVANSDVSSLVAKLEQLSINLVKLNEEVNSRSSTNKSFVPQNNVGGGNRSNFICYYCRDEGHRKYECPKFLRDQAQVPSTPATGSNAIPIATNVEESGKGNEQQ